MKRHRPLQILWLVPAYPSESDPVGGIFHKTEVHALEHNGAEVRVVAPVPWVPPMLDSFRAKWQQYKNTPEQYMDGSIKVHRPRYLALPRANHLAIPDHMLIRNKILRMSMPKPDLIHAHFSFPLGLTAVHLSRLWGVPSVLTLHGSDVNVYPQMNRLNNRRFCDAVTGSASVLAVSQALSDRTKVLSGVGPIVKPVGINLQAYRSLPSKRGARLQLGLPQDAFLVLYVGYLVETKGIRELRQAIRELAEREEPSIMGVFVGGGEMLEELKQTPRIISAGVQPNTRIPLYLAAADLLVLPSYREGLPTVLVEAGAAGTPVIASNVGGIPELLGEGRGCMIPAKSVKALKLAIKDVREKKSDTFRRAERLKKYVYEHYDANANAQKLITLYEGLVGRTPQVVP